MDKRLLNFMLVSMILFIGYMELLKLTRPPVPVDADNEPAVEEVAGDLPPGPDGAAAEPENTAEVQTTEAVAEAEADPVEPEAVAAQPQRFTVGSVDPSSGFRMLVTFNSRGAAVERVELSDPRYRDLEDKSAYIGHLAPEPVELGVEVHVVGDGTPAAAAGVQVGDVITMLGEEATNSPESFEFARQKYKAGEDVPVTLVRDGRDLNLVLKSRRRPLEVIRPERMPNGSLELQQPSYLLTLHQVRQRMTDFGQEEIPNLPSLRTSNWAAQLVDENGVKKVEFRFPLSTPTLKKIGVDGALEVVKRFWLEPRSEEDPQRDYHFGFEVEVINKGSESIDVGYRLDGPTGLPLEGWWYSYKTHPTKWSGAGVRDVVWREEGGKHQFYTNPMVTKRLKKGLEPLEEVIVETGAPKKLQYLGIDAQYFNSTLLAANDPQAGAVVLQRVDARALSEIDEQRASKTPITFRADSSVLVVPPQQSLTHQFEVFAGPKHPDVLDDYGLGESIVYGWFSWPAKLMGMLLHGLYAIVRNYGLAIILLTLIVRGCMFPIGRQQAMNAKKMQELTPEIKKIKEKYPGDTEKQAKAQQELFRKHKYNPVAGCLPMFLQLPIFIGLYRALSVDIELRQTPLIPGMDWCSNLAAPDMLFRWDDWLPIEFLTGYAGYLGPYLNLLPLISTGLFLVHQQMFTPPPTDEQQEMQQKVMKFMMLFMLVIFFKVPAGLCLYFITSSIWALAERMLLPKDNKATSEQTPVSLADVQPEAAGVSSGGGNAAAAAKKKRRKRNKK